MEFAFELGLGKEFGPVAGNVDAALFQFQQLDVLLAFSRARFSLRSGRDRTQAWRLSKSAWRIRPGMSSSGEGTACLRHPGIRARLSTPSRSTWVSNCRTAPLVGSAPRTPMPTG